MSKTKKTQSGEFCSAGKIATESGMTETDIESHENGQAGSKVVDIINGGYYQLEVEYTLVSKRYERFTFRLLVDGEKQGFSNGFIERKNDWGNDGMTDWRFANIEIENATSVVDIKAVTVANHAIYEVFFDLVTLE